MGKPSKIPREDGIEHAVKIAQAEDMPVILTDMAQNGWQLLQIVLCQGGMHAAYFRRVLT